MEGGTGSIAPIIPKIGTRREWLNSRPHTFSTPVVPIVTEGRLGPTVGLECFGKENNLFPLPEFEPRTVRPVSNRYNNKVMPPRVRFDSQTKQHLLH
jgi:hypothetical protein